MAHTASALMSSCTLPTYSLPASTVDPAPVKLATSPSTASDSVVAPLTALKIVCSSAGVQLNEAHSPIELSTLIVVA